MSTTSGGNTDYMQENSVTTLYDGDRMAVNHRVSPPSSSNADSGLDNSNTESSAGDAKLIIDVPDFSKEMETPRTGIDNPSFETDKTDIPKPVANGHNGTVNQEKDKMAEAVNLELINMKPFGKSINGKENGVPTKKKETAVNMNDTYDDYFIPVNEHKKYIRGGEKLYVTKDKRDMNQSKKPFICWVFGLVLLAAAVIVAILASTGIIFNNETAVESRNFMENEKIAGFGNHHRHFSSVSPPPSAESSSPFSPPTTDMSVVYLPRTVQGEIVIDNMQFTPDLANKSTAEFKTLASSIETELKNALFKKQPLNSVADDIHIKVIEFSSGSVVAKYRIGWEYKDDSEPQDLIDAVTLNTRLDSYLRETNGYLYNYRVPIHRLRSDLVMDKCKIDNGKCSHYCSYDYTSLEFVCSCPSELTISENKKDCKRINVNNDLDDINVNYNKQNEEDSFDTKSEYDSFSELDPSTEPEAKPELKIDPEPSSISDASTEPKFKSEPEPSSEPEVKAEPEPSSVPKTKSEPELSSVPEVEPEPKSSSKPDIVAEFELSPEPEVKAESMPSSEPEPSSVPEVNAKPEPSSVPEVKAEPEPSSVPEVKAEPEPSSEPEVKAEPEPSSLPEVKAEPEPSSASEVKAEPEPSSVPEVKAEPEPSSVPEVKAEPEPSSVPEVKAESESSSLPEVKAEPEPSSLPEVKAEPEPSSVSEIKSEPEPSSEPEVKAEPEPNSVPTVRPESEVKSSQPEQEIKSEIVTKIDPDTKPEPEPEPSAEPNSKSSSIDTYESLSDVDISSESDFSEQNNKPFSSSSTEKSIINMDQSDREAKSHSEEVFSHEIKPEVTYSVSTEAEFETKTESPSKHNSKPKEGSELLGDVDLNVPEESSTIPPMTENWLTTSSSIIPGIPKLPSDLEVTEKENASAEEEMKTESLGFEQMELKSANKSTIDFISESHSKSPIEEITEMPETTISDDIKDLSGVVTVSTVDASSTIKDDINIPIKESENIASEHVTEFIDMTTMSSTNDQELINPLHSSTEPNSSEKKHSDDLIILEKTSIPDPTKKLQSLTSLEDQTTNLPYIDVLSTSTQSNIDNFNENSSPDEQDVIDKIITHSSESNMSDVVNENDNMSALDLYQKPESKKKDKKTSKNPEFYLSESGFTKRNKTKTEKEKEIKKNNKSDVMDMIPELLNSNKCEEGQFQCVNGTTKDGSYCIKMSSRCDTNKDCTDNSDEYNCAENACSGNFQCKSGECLQRNLVCNNIMECEDGSDEQSCDLWKCTNDEKQCTGGQCLPISYFCDGKSDCNDHSDELQCNSTCDGYQCSNSYCISSTLRCNGVNDCVEGEDEQNCECDSNEFKCNTGSECIPKNQVCDNVAQCTDRSDEWQCVQLDGVQLFAKKESEIAMKICSDNWSDTWSNFVCQSLGFTETKTTNFRTNENFTENVVGYLKLKDNSTLTSSKSLTEYLEPASTSCETVEIKCSSKHLCGDFGGKDPLSMEIWPSVVYLHNTRTQKSCTSSLVKRNWILSSYSCVHSIDESLSPEQWEAISSKSRVANEQNLTKRSVSRIISHPGVKFEKLRYFNDSVLVELNIPYDLSEEVNTICLPEQVVDNKQPCVTASWSYESPGVFKQFSRYLSEPLMQKDLCNSTEHFNGFLTEQEICVASKEMEASNMEIGSPLMCLAENGLWQVQGMLSYQGGYGRSSKPSLYNAILESVPWIENTVAYFGV